MKASLITRPPRIRLVDSTQAGSALGAAALKAGSSLDVIMHKVFEIRGEDGVLLLTILFSEAFR